MLQEVPTLVGESPPPASIMGFGRYNLLVKLGQGGMGAVFLARHKTLRRFCAIKVIGSNISQDPGSTERFLREARATASFSHPNLISIFDCDRFEGQSFIAMEYVEGMSLAEIIRSQGPLPLPLALGWLMQAATALEYIHHKQVIHRDIKPDNMMIDADGILKIMDLGLAKDRLEADQGMTMTGMIMGSPHYMSPEQINDSKTADHCSDLYSLGISFFQMLKGHVPFQRSSGSLVCIAHLQEPIPPLDLADPVLNQELDSLIGKMTAKKKEERFQSATEILAAIQPLIGASPIDVATQEFFSGLGFENRKVFQILKRNGIPENQVDADFSKVLLTQENNSRVPTIAPGVPPMTVAPHAAASGFARLSMGKRIAIGFTGCILLLFGLKILSQLKHPLPNPQNPEVVQKPQPPKPEAPLPIPPAEPAVKLGGLLLKTIPENAIVMFGSKSLPSPASFSDVPVGKHTVQISLDGYQNTNQEVNVEENQFTEVEISLIPSPAIKKEAPKPQPNPSPPNSLEQWTEKWVENLDKAMQADNNHWAGYRQGLLGAVGRSLNQKGVQGPIAAKALTDVGTIVDQARSSSPDIYNEQKEKLAREIVMVLGTAISRGHGGQNAQLNR